jgi:uncharacterized membrane protein YraQ (UPF0718 family)
MGFDFVQSVGRASWHLLLDSALYILMGLLVAGLLKVFLSPDFVARHLGRSRFGSVFKAALFGIPIPLCSCGVLPAAAGLKRQGANKGSTTAFLISTPESGVDSIAVSWALLDPILTVARPLSAFATALVAGISENLLFWEKNQSGLTQGGGQSDGSGCTCKDNGCGQEEQLVAGKGRLEQVINGLRFAATDIWGDIAGWFFLGVVLAGLITVLIPEAFIHQYLGGGIKSMLLMLVIGVPLYICATASTPIASAFILKGVSPGTALVFLLVGPATNITSLTVLARILGKRATGFYLATVSLVSLGCGMTVDHIYRLAGINPIAVVGKAGDVIPFELRLFAVLLLLLISLRPLYKLLVSKLFRTQQETCCTDERCAAQSQSTQRLSCGCHVGHCSCD